MPDASTNKTPSALLCFEETLVQVLLRSAGASALMMPQGVTARYGPFAPSNVSTGVNESFDIDFLEPELYRRGYDAKAIACEGAIDHVFGPVLILQRDRTTDRVSTLSFFSPYRHRLGEVQRYLAEVYRVAVGLGVDSETIRLLHSICRASGKKSKHAPCWQVRLCCLGGVIAFYVVEGDCFPDHWQVHSTWESPNARLCGLAYDSGRIGVEGFVSFE